jgi:glycosyltransferase involved in cell wall biosynthesis
MVLLIGNYAPDQQQSMQRFSTMMLQGLTAAGVRAELVQPAPVFGNFRAAGAFVAKWLGYVDKFVLFPRQLRKRLRSGVSLVHICDHSNAMYAKEIRGVPVVVTCHDMLAVRGALGEETDTPASRTGRVLQRWIVSGLRSAEAIACVSRATMRDVERIVPRGKMDQNVTVITSGLNYPYCRLPAAEAQARLTGIEELNATTPFVLHVGSNLRRKNREAVLRVFARVAGKWPGQLVFAGDKLNHALQSQAEQLGITRRIVQVVNPTSPVLEALYSTAAAFLFPSRFEGFGWPIAEAQACGCPVLTSAAEPMSEVAGDGALLHDPEDDGAFAADLLRLLDPAEQTRWREASLRNAQRFATDRMIEQYCSLYRQLAQVC